MKFFPDSRNFSYLAIVLTIVVISPSIGFTQDTPPIERADRLIDTNRLDRADSILRSILREDTGNELALGYLIRISQQRGDRQRTYRLYRRLADRPAEQFERYKPVDVFYNAGKLAYQMEDYAYAVEQINRAQEQLTEDQQSLREQMEGWKIRAKTAQKRLKGQERREQLRTITNGVIQRLADQRWADAQQFLHQQERPFSESDTYKALNELIAYFQRFEQWNEEISAVSGPPPAPKLDGLIDTGQGFLQENTFDSLLSAVSGQQNRASLEEMHNELRESIVIPSLADLYLGKANLQYDRGNYEGALDYLLRIRSFSEDRLEVSIQSKTLLLLARSKYQLGRTAEARNHLTELRQSYPGQSIPSSLDWSIWLYNWGPSIAYTILVAGGILALGFYLIVRFSSRFFTLVGQYLGGVTFHQGWVEVSFWLYHLLCDPERMDPDDLKRYMSVARQAGRTEERLELLRRGHEAGRLEADDSVEYGRLIRSQSGEQAKDVLESALTEWSDLSPGSREKLARNLSQIYLENNQTSRAYKLLKKLLKHQESDSKLLKQLTGLAATLERWDEWVSLGKRWHRSVSDSYVQSSQRRVIGDTEDDRELADPEAIASRLLQQYDDNREVTLEEEDTERLEFLLQMMDEANQPDSSTSPLLEELMNRDLKPQNHRRYGRQLAEIYLDEERTGDALEILSELREEYPEDLEILTALGSIYVNRDDRAKAYDVYIDILGLQKDNVQARNQLQRLGRRYEDENDFEEAERFYRAILDHSSFQQPETQLRLGAVLYKQGQTEDALSMFQQINQGESEFKAKVLGHIGRCLVDLDMHDVAVDRLETVEFEDGSVPVETRHTLHYWRGRAREGSGDRDGALEDYRQIMASDVDFRDVSDRVDRLREQTG